MTDETTAQDARDADLGDLSIQELRSLAKHLGITNQRDWDKLDYVKAIKAQRDEAAAALADYQTKSVSKDLPNVPKPGYARIMIFRDPATGHANSPVPVGVNGRMFFMPRGMEIDVPIPHVEALNNARQTVIRQTQEPDINHPSGKVVEEIIQSYPFQVLAITPGGKFVAPDDQRGAMARRKQAFVAVHKRYPTQGELQEFEKALVQKNQTI